MTMKIDPILVCNLKYDKQMQNRVSQCMLQSIKLIPSSCLKVSGKAACLLHCITKEASK